MTVSAFEDGGEGSPAVVVGAPTRDGTFTVKVAGEAYIRHGVAPSRLALRSRRVSAGEEVSATRDDGTSVVGTVKWLWPDGNVTLDAAGDEHHVYHHVYESRVYDPESNMYPLEYRTRFSESCGGIEKLVKLNGLKKQSVEKMLTWAGSDLCGIEVGVRLDIRLFGWSRSETCQVIATGCSDSDKPTFDATLMLGDCSERLNGLAIACVEAGVRVGSTYKKGGIRERMAKGAAKRRSSGSKLAPDSPSAHKHVWGRTDDERTCRRVVPGTDVVVRVGTWNTGTIESVEANGTYTVKSSDAVGSKFTGVTENDVEPDRLIDDQIEVVLSDFTDGTIKTVSGKLKERQYTLSTSWGAERRVRHRDLVNSVKPGTAVIDKKGGRWAVTKVKGTTCDLSLLPVVAGVHPQLPVVVLADDREVKYQAQACKVVSVDNDGIYKLKLASAGEGDDVETIDNVNHHNIDDCMYQPGEIVRYLDTEYKVASSVEIEAAYECEIKKLGDVKGLGEGDEGEGELTQLDTLAEIMLLQIVEGQEGEGEGGG